MSEKNPSKCKDCGRIFDSGYSDNLIDRKVKRCDEFEWCWDCDDKHTEQEIRNQTLAQVEKIIDKYFEIDCECDTDYTLGRIRKEVKNLKEKHE